MSCPMFAVSTVLSVFLLVPARLLATESDDAAPDGAAVVEGLAAAEDAENDEPLADQPLGPWIPLFNGRDLTGWSNPYEWGEANVVAGEIHLTANRKFFLVTDKIYRDFILEGDVLLPAGTANSGFMFRCHVEPNRVYGYQAEVDGSERRWSGGLYDEGRRAWVWPSQSGRTKDPKMLEYEQESQAFFAQPTVRNALRRDDWNTYRITCRGNSLKIEVNDVVTTEIRDDLDREGPVGIQHHGEKGQTYRFRKLRIREL